MHGTLFAVQSPERAFFDLHSGHYGPRDEVGLHLMPALRRGQARHLFEEFHVPHSRDRSTRPPAASRLFRRHTILSGANFSAKFS